MGIVSLTYYIYIIYIYNILYIYYVVNICGTFNSMHTVISYQIIHYKNHKHYIQLYSITILCYYTIS